MKKQRSLMIIDDNYIDQELYKMIVDRSGLVDNLLQFYMAGEALDYLKAGTEPEPDLILLDVHMPQMNGFEFLEEYEAAMGDAMRPIVVMLTTSLNPSDEAQAMEFSSVEKFINKPLTKELFKTLADEFLPSD